MYPYLPALTGAREIRVPLAEGDVHDLDAMAAEVTAATQLLIVCNPNNPTATHLPAARDRRLLRADPRPRDGRSSTRPTSSSRPTTTPTRRSTCSPTSPTWSSCAPSASATASPGCGSATRSARRSSAPRSTPCASRSASTPSPRRPGPRRSCTRTTSLRRVESDDRRAAPGRGGAARARPRAPPRPRPTSPGSTSATPTRREVVAGLAERQIAVRPGTPLGGPGHIRVSYGTARRERPLPRRARRTARLTARPAATKSAVVMRSGIDTASSLAPTGAALAPAAFAYFWRFS